MAIFRVGRRFKVEEAWLTSRLNIRSKERKYYTMNSRNPELRRFQIRRRGCLGSYLGFGW